MALTDNRFELKYACDASAAEAPELVTLNGITRAKLGGQDMTVHVTGWLVQVGGQWKYKMLAALAMPEPLKAPAEEVLGQSAAAQ